MFKFICHLSPNGYNMLIYRKILRDRLVTDENICHQYYSKLHLVCTTHWKRLMCLSLIIYYLAQVFHHDETTVSKSWNNCFIIME